jgi:hypothetical protein
MYQRLKGNADKVTWHNAPDPKNIAADTSIFMGITSPKICQKDSVMCRFEVKKKTLTYPVFQ